MHLPLFNNEKQILDGYVFEHRFCAEVVDDEQIASKHIVQKCVSLGYGRRVRGEHKRAELVGAHKLHRITFSTIARAIALARQVLPVPTPPENTRVLHLEDGNLSTYFFIES